MLQLFEICETSLNECSVILVLCTCHGAHTREEQEQADEDLNSNNSL